MMKRTGIWAAFAGIVLTASSASAFQSEGFLCSVPQRDPRSEDVPSARIKIAADGTTTWNDIRIGAKDRDAYIDESKEYDPHPEFRVSADANAPFRSVQPALEKILDAGTYWMTLNTVSTGHAKILCFLKSDLRLKATINAHVGLSRDGKLLWNGWPVDEQTFDDYMRKLARDQQPAPRVVVIEPDPDTGWGAVIATADKLIAAGFRDIAIGRYGNFVPERKP